jgi:sugar O-acyltransferase (sialic acid O-acetyltransferase NeuD family)
MGGDVTRTVAVEKRASSDLSPLKRIVVIGCSGHAEVVVDIVEKQGLYDVAGFLDSYKPLGMSLAGYQVLGTCEDLPTLITGGRVNGGIVAIGDNWLRWKVVTQLIELAPAFPFLTAVHPSAQIGAGVEIGRGTVVMAGAVINPGCSVGDFCIVNTRASLDHDSVMGDFSSLAPAAVTGGNVQIGAFSVVAIGAIVAHAVRVGEHTVIGAGATVLRDVPDRVVAYGTPARIIREREPGDPYLGVWGRGEGSSLPRQRTVPAACGAVPVHPMPKSLSVFPANGPDWAAFLERAEHDFFHTAEYHYSSQESGEGDAMLAVYGDRDRFLAWPYLLRRIGAVGEHGLSGLRDVTSAYGYVGPLACGCSEDDAFLGEAWKALVQFWRNQDVVCVFTRFHPLLRNHRLAERFASSDPTLGTSRGLSSMGQTVAIDLLSPVQEVWDKYKRPLRQHIRRAERLGLVSTPDPAWNRLDDFMRLYYSTMQRNRATPFYFFPTEYFQRLRCALGVHGSLMVTCSGDQVASAGLLIEYGGIVTAHLAASDDAFHEVSPCKILLHDASLWARQRGNRLFHIGGGRGAKADDPLFRFKAEFSEQHHPFFTGRWILDEERYGLLTDRQVRKAAEAGCEFDREYFPAYRAPLSKLQVGMQAIATATGAPAKVHSCT